MTVMLSHPLACTISDIRESAQAIIDYIDNIQDDIDLKQIELWGDELGRHIYNYKRMISHE